MKKLTLLLTLAATLATTSQAIQMKELNKHESFYCYFYGTSQKNGYFVDRYAIVEADGDKLMVDLDTRQITNIRYCHGIDKTIAYRKTSRLK